MTERRAPVEAGGWHLPPEGLRRYADPVAGGPSAAGPAEAASVEAHLDRCPMCRSRLRPAADAELLDRVGRALAERIELVPQYRRPSRLRVRWTAGLPLAWLLAAFVVSGLAGLLDAAAKASGSQRPSLLLLVAPVLPLLPVAAAWTPRLDPLHELTGSTPSAGLAMVLRRTLVLLLSVVLLSAGIAALGVAAPPARWLLPCLALTAVSLALGRVVRPHLTAAGLSAVWCAAVVLPALDRGRVPAPLQTSAASAWAALLLVAVVLVIAQHRTYQRFGF